ncbi:MAG: aminotransferase class IV [Methylacidiphilales bacterium]|nr:aminotransferase class IV [Candidatus Methylacidiphilales bacterium]
MSQTPPEFAPWLGVFETLRVVEGMPLFFREHREELSRAMAALELKSDFDFEKAGDDLEPNSGRWRWIVTTEGTRTLFSSEEVLPAGPGALSVSPVRVGSANWDARFKTVSYLTHAQAAKTAPTPEVVLLNEFGHVASASRGNIFWRRAERLFTPSEESGCRRGVVRGFVLKRCDVTTGPFPLDELLEADEVFVTNSMKGIVSMNECQGRSLVDFSTAEGLRNEYAKEIAAQLMARPD